MNEEQKPHEEGEQLNFLNRKIKETMNENDKDRGGKSFSKLNPVTTFQNEMNSIAETDFYAYRDYRTRIQEMIDKKIELILEDTWNNVTVDKNRYSEYVKNFEYARKSNKVFRILRNSIKIYEHP